MKWLQSVLIDIAITVVILVATVLGPEWATWVVWIYTPFMVLMKVLAFFGSGMVGAFKPGQAAPPPWFLHLLYAVNTGALLVNSWWIWAAQWALIWILSFAAEARARPKAKK